MLDGLDEAVGTTYIALKLSMSFSVKCALTLINGQELVGGEINAQVLTNMPNTICFKLPKDEALKNHRDIVPKSPLSRPQEEHAHHKVLPILVCK